MNPLPFAYRKGKAAHFFELNTSYIPMYRVESGQGELRLSTRVIYWTMCVTEIYRIFNINDLKEYLFRLGLVIQTQFSLKDYFLEDKLFEFKFNNGIHYLTVEDIFDNIGIQAKDDWENFITGGWYAGDIPGHLLAGSMRTKFSGGIVPGIEYKKFIDKIGCNTDSEINQTVMTNAEFFAEDVLKRMPSTLFTVLDSNIQDKIQELKARSRHYYNTAPIFNENTLSDGLKYRCMRILHRAYGKNYLPNLKDFSSFTKAMLHLARLFTNQYMIPQEYGGFVVQECTHLKEELYFDGDGKLDFRRIRDVFELKIIESIMRNSRNY